MLPWRMGGKLPPVVAYMATVQLYSFTKLYSCTLFLYSCTLFSVQLHFCVCRRCLGRGWTWSLSEPKIVPSVKLYCQLYSFTKRVFPGAAGATHQEPRARSSPMHGIRDSVNVMGTLLVRRGCVQVDVRLPGKGNSNSHVARPVHLIITMIKWIRTSRLSIKKKLYLCRRCRGRRWTWLEDSPRLTSCSSALALTVCGLPYIYIYIYIYMYIYIYIYVCVFVCVCVYIYKEREGDRERERAAVGGGLMLIGVGLDGVWPLCVRA